jgi:hypothetical protein
MPTTNSRSKLSSIAILLSASLLGGCSGGIGDMFGGSSSGLATTASIPETPKVDPACTTLVSQIDGLKKDGVADKVAQAAAKKYKMSAADLTKADQLNKANGDFQAKCAVGPKPSQSASMTAPIAAAATQAVTAQASTAATTAAKAAVAKAQ